jgi:hypothetical protein
MLFTGQTSRLLSAMLDIARFCKQLSGYMSLRDDRRMPRVTVKQSQKVMPAGVVQDYPLSSVASFSFF